MAAAYASLLYLSQIIHQILHRPPTHHFLIPTRQIQCLQQEISFLIDFLEKYSTHETEHLEELIVAAAHEAEDIIESYVVTQIQAKYDGLSEPHGIPEEIRELLPIQNELKKEDVLKVIQKFISIREEADKFRIREGVEKTGPENPTAAGSSRSVPGGNNIMIGFDEHLDRVRTALATDELDLQIIPVVRMGGIGKTTVVRRWSPNANEFRQLKYLRIAGSEMKIWEADDSHFPCLEHLHLVDMKMEEIPIEFAEIPTLKTINLNCCSISLFESAKRISREREFFGYEEVHVQSFHSKKVVLTVGIHDEREKRKIMKIVSRFSGVKSLAMDMKENKLTVIGDTKMDVIQMVGKLRKSRYTNILSVGPAVERYGKKDGEKHAQR